MSAVHWTDAEDEALRAAWAAGLSTKAIGKQLGRTKNCVVGRAHRLHLPSRESPIKPPRSRPGKRGCQFIAGEPDWLHRGDAIYCGGEIVKNSLCDEHYHKCWVKPGELPAVPFVENRALKRALG